MSDFHGCAPWDFNCVIAVSGNDQSNASDKQGQQQQRRDVLRPSMLPRKIDSPCREKEAKTTCKDRPAAVQFRTLLSTDAQPSHSFAQSTLSKSDTWEQKALAPRMQNTDHGDAGYATNFQDAGCDAHRVSRRRSAPRAGRP